MILAIALIQRNLYIIIILVVTFYVNTGWLTATFVQSRFATCLGEFLQSSIKEPAVVLSTALKKLISDHLKTRNSLVHSSIDLQLSSQFVILDLIWKFHSFYSIFYSSSYQSQCYTFFHHYGLYLKFKQLKITFLVLARVRFHSW